MRLPKTFVLKVQRKKDKEEGGREGGRGGGVYNAVLAVKGRKGKEMSAFELRWETVLINLFIRGIGRREGRSEVRERERVRDQNFADS